MDSHKNKAYPLRINNELMEKIKIIAGRSKEKRSVNKYIELILKRHVTEYEYKNGFIKIDLGNEIDHTYNEEI